MSDILTKEQEQINKTLAEIKKMSEEHKKLLDINANGESGQIAAENGYVLIPFSKGVPALPIVNGAIKTTFLVDLAKSIVAGFENQQRNVEINQIQDESVRNAIMSANK